MVKLYFNTKVLFINMIIWEFGCVVIIIISNRTKCIQNQSTKNINIIFNIK